MVNDVVADCPWCKATIPARSNAKNAQRCPICYKMFKIRVTAARPEAVSATKASDDD